MDFSVFKFPSTFRRTIPSPCNWTIDRERNAFFLTIAASAEKRDYPLYYVLAWANTHIYVALKLDATGNFKDGMVVNWKLHQLWLPENLKNRRKDVIGVIK